jgi:hypothetical protein
MGVSKCKVPAVAARRPTASFSRHCAHPAATPPATLPQSFSRFLSDSYLHWLLTDSRRARLETGRALEIGCPAVWASQTYQGARALGGAENQRPTPGLVEQIKSMSGS